MAKVTLTKRMATNLESQLEEIGSREGLMKALAKYQFGSAAGPNRNQSFKDLAEFFQSSNDIGEDEWVGADIIAQALYGDGYVMVETPEERIWDFLMQQREIVLGKNISRYKHIAVGKIRGALEVMHWADIEVDGIDPDTFIEEVIHEAQWEDVCEYGK